MTSQHHVKTVASELNLADLLEKAHTSLTGVLTSQHHVKTVASELNLADLAEKSYNNLTNKPTILEGIGLQTNDVVHSNDAEKTTGNTSYTKIKSTLVYKNFKSIKVRWDHHGIEAPSGITTRLYINGVAVGSEHWTAQTMYEQVFENLTDIEYGDDIQIYGKVDTASGVCYVNNMKICFIKYKINDP